MNKIFKVIWNKTTQSVVVVSELAKSVSGSTKSTSTSNATNVFKLTAITGSLLVALSADASVNLGTVSSTDVGVDTIVVGERGTKAKASNSQVIGGNTNVSSLNNTVIGNDITTDYDNSILIGNKAGSNIGSENGGRNIIIGTNAQVGMRGTVNSQSIAIGSGLATNETLNPNVMGGSLTEGAWARGDQSVAIGGNVVAYGNSSVAIGGDDTTKASQTITKYIDPITGKEVTGTGRVAFKSLTGVDMQVPLYRNTQAGEASVALGAKTYAGDLSLALGTVATAEKTNTVAIGSASHAKYANSVAIGGGSVTDKEGRAYVTQTILGKTYTWAGGAQTIAGDIVSFGKKGYERQLINIAPGEVSETSTDAINGSQLFGVMNSLERGPIVFKGNENKVFHNLDTGLNETVAGANKKEGTGNRLNSTIQIVGGVTGTDETSASNLKTVVTDGKVEIQMKTKPEFKGTTLKDGNNVVDLAPTADGLKLANGTSNVKISGVANGTKAGDAVNFEQLDALKNSPITFAGNTGNIVKKLGETLKIYGSDITANAGANGIELTLNKGNVASGETKAVSGGDVYDAINTAKNSIVLNTKAGSTTGSVNLADKSLTFVSSDLDITTANENVNLGLSTAIKNKINSIDTKIGDNKIKLTGDDGSTNEVDLSNNGGINFDIKGGATSANSGGYALTENNIAVEKTTTGVKLKLAPVLKGMKDITLDSDDGVNKLAINANNGLTFTNGADGSTVKLNHDGLNNGGHKITNVGEGAVTKTSTDAVNGSQLFKVKEDIEKSQYKGWKVNTDKVTGGENTGSASTDVASTDEVKFIAGKNIKIAQNGKDLTFSTTDEISASKVTVGDVELGSNGINAGNKVISNVADGNIAANSKEAVNGGQLHELKEEIRNTAATGYKGWKLTTDKVDTGESDGAEIKNIASETQVKFIAGKNMKVIQNGADVTFTTVADLVADSIKIGDVIINSDGINAGNKVVSNVDNGVADKDAVNVSQLKDAKDTLNNKIDTTKDDLINKGFAIQATGGTVTKKLGEAVEMVGDDNITVKAENGKINVNLNKDLVLTGGSITMGDNVMNDDGFKAGTNTFTKDGLKVGDVNINNDGINAGNKIISNVADGKINPTSKDAVNGSQLYAVQKDLDDTKQAINNDIAGVKGDINTMKGDIADLNTKVDNAKVDAIDTVTKKGFGIGTQNGSVMKELGQKVDIVGKDNIETKVKNGQVVIEMKKDVDLTNDGSLTIGNNKINKDGAKIGDVTITDKGINAGNKKIADVANGLVAKDSKEAVNGGQLFEIDEKIKNISTTANAGFNITTDSVNGGEVTGTTIENVRPTETVKFTAGKNIKVEQKGKEIVVATSDNLKVTTITAGDTVVSDDGITISTGPALTKNGLNMGGKKVTNVADGEISENSKDAVTGSQIYALAGDQKDIVTQNEFVNTKGQKVTTNTKVVTDKDGKALLKTYNVEGNTEIVSNNVIEAINNMNEQGIKFFHSNDGVKRTPKAEDTNDFDSSATGKYATAIGAKTKVNGDQSSGLGVGNTINANDSVAVGNTNTINKQKSGTYGSGNTINGENSYVVGNDNTIESSNTVVVGNNVKSTADNSVILGNNSGYSKASNRTAGNGALTSQVLNGKERHFAGGAANEVVGVVSVGNTTVDPSGKETVQTRRIQNVAPGLISKDSTDAINGSQLYALMEENSQNLGKLKGQVNKMQKRHRAGLAGVNAAATLPQVFLPGKSMVSVGAGHYKGQNAIAVGYSRAADSGKLIFKLQGNVNTQGEFGAGAGIGYQW
jgi:vtaA11